MPNAPNMPIPANTDEQHQRRVEAGLPRHQDRPQEVVDVRHHDEVEHDDEDAAEYVAEQDHSDAERNRDDAAAERDDRQRAQKYREDEEAVVEAGDVDRDRSRDALAHGDDELPSDRATHHRAHLREVEVGDLLAERIELADQRSAPRPCWSAVR